MKQSGVYVDAELLLEILKNAVVLRIDDNFKKPPLLQQSLQKKHAL